MEDNTAYEKENEGISLVNIFFLIKKYILLILAVTLAACVIGFAFAKLRKPNYIAKERLTYKVTYYVDVKDKDGNVVGKKEDNVSATNFMLTYFDTVLDFCKTGKVLDRANLYYRGYLEKYFVGADGNRERNIDKFVNYVLTEKPSFEELADDAERLINEDTVTVKRLDKDDIINIEISVKSKGKDKACLLTRIYALAIRTEAENAFGTDVVTTLKETLPDDSGLSAISVTKVVSTTKILLISGIMGLVLSFIIIYLLYVTDTTVTSPEELNKISGVNLLSSIEDQEAQNL